MLFAKLSVVIISFSAFAACSDSNFSGSSATRQQKLAPPKDELATPERIEPLPPPPPPKFGMLVNDLKCSFCHLQVRGNVVSVTSIPALHPGSNGSVTGDWILAGDWKAEAVPAGKTVPVISVSGQKLQNSTDSKLFPREPGSDKVSFPLIDWGAAKATSKIKELKNTVLIGTDASPIDVTGDIFVDGDLIIKGRYKGIGTIYVKGNVYIPANLIAMQSPFPYDNDPSVAAEQAKKALAENKDALAIATEKSIVIGAFEKRTTDKNTSVFSHVETDAFNTGEALGLSSGDSWLVYNWYPKAQFDLLWDKTNPLSQDCTGNVANKYPPLQKYISRIDAFLYAKKAIAGRANNSSYAINGGVIADHFHIIAAGGHCTTSAAHPVHGYASNKNHLNYDWRLQVGLGLLQHMGSYFAEE